MNKYLVRNFKWRENLGKVPAEVYRLGGGKDLATLLAAVLTWSGYWMDMRVAMIGCTDGILCSNIMATVLYIL